MDSNAIRVPVGLLEILTKVQVSETAADSNVNKRRNAAIDPDRGITIHFVPQPRATRFVKSVSFAEAR